ncbi:ATP-dependent RNA helicase dbp9 [Fulvia fulva]|uniref:RNA helicase n=1 Tax=Passalora fulva TaxID=5499 RepID=A0A9Q8P8P4_PASFU|nr:ATP-dependent RNA helicase dbp9 [Fulvia fulva]KAK4623722.1 ATP-dependent RNA helicase dbp9 [Fulvia fulva]KAK4625494.1 ATP-dependent RNA helicase dbp9 [Fulvia fulva]UJO17222.1 ATP-dependent RNA helicase dbp9 [Fulvia fulva]WPV14477.1 ATP-dependent RNA helicase dbp9 [Fulvia fulva]WPV30263.1 ATP-dependent RNA helicase dbp9 [Fulvia fulva]
MAKRKLNAQDIPEPVDGEDNSKATSTKATKATFATLNLDSRLLQAVNKSKFSAPTPVQIKAIPLAIEGKDILARAKTGSGKTLAYLLPTLHNILQRKAANKRSKTTSALILVPTKELATQVATTVKDFTSFCAGDIRCENITRKEDAAVTKARLAEKPDIVVATPARAVQWSNDETLNLDEVKHLIIDEADLVLSYGYEDDLKSIATSLPAGVQKMMVSATMRTEVDTLSSLFFGKEEGAGPEVLDLSSEEAAEKPTLAQYTVRTAEDEKFLLIYAIFKLQLIKGKVIIFVADIDRCYRIKLFLEQFGIRSCVLNSELPVNSRLHVVEEFNRGVYDIIIAADEGGVVGIEEAKNAHRKRRRLEKEEKKEEEEEEIWEGMADDVEAGAEDGEEDTAAPAVQRPAKKERKPRNDREYGVSRGIDFRYVTCVLNFDLPTTSKSYTHRIGRTARAGQSGMALTFYVPQEHYRKHKPTSIPQCEKDEKVLEKIKQKQADKGSEIKEWGLDWAKLEGFRYRLADALRSVTRIAVREARTKELRNELIKSEKLKRHFEENPEDLRHLRHDTESHAVRQQPHLKHVPDYLLPSGGKAAVSKDVGFVWMRKERENRIRKARAVNKGRGKGRLAKGKGLDPLKSLNAKGRGKK